jgi:hypothetical protein
MQINPITIYIKYLFEDCYKEDYNIYDYENNNDIYCNNYTFIEWYFRYRKLWCLNKNKVNNHKYTPDKLIIALDILDSGYTFI